MTITWDAWAVPTITGADDLEVVRGIGHAQAVAVGRDVLQLYGVARGESASYWGEEFLGEDRFTAQLGLKARTDEWLSQQTPSTLERIAAFCEGFNTACEEDDSLGAGRREVLPVVPRDVIAHLLRVFVRFNQIDGDQLAFDPADFSGVKLAGSNSWAIAGSRSTTGRAQVMINPHLSWSIPFHRFIEMRTVSPTRTFEGVTLIGSPWQSMGHNEHVAWGHTVNPIRNLVVFELKDVTEDEYSFDGGRLSFDRVEHVIAVRDAEPVTVVERRSVHGPVITAPDGTTVAVRIAGVLNHPAYWALDGWWDMSLATSIEEMFAAHDKAWLPMFNITAGDSSGSVGGLYCGTPPVRSSWDETRRRLPGDDPAFLPDEVHPASAMPRVIDPECGWINNCNETPFLWCDPPLDESDWPAAIAPPTHLVDDLRPFVSRDRLKQLAEVTPEQLRQLKFSKRVVLADIVLDELVAAASGEPELEPALKVLTSWDRYAHADSAGYSLLWLWTMLNAPRMMDRTFVVPGAEPGALPTGLQDPADAVEKLTLAVATMGLLGLPLDLSVGQLMTLGEGTEAVPADGGSGLMGVLKSFELVPTATGAIEVAVADTYVSHVQFQEGRPPLVDSLLVYGNTTEPAAPSSPSQFALWAGDELRPAGVTSR